MNYQETTDNLPFGLRTVTNSTSTEFYTLEGIAGTYGWPSTHLITPPPTRAHSAKLI